jgi:hypothetical protein
LFGGNDQHKRYYKSLKKAVAEIPADVDLGCERDDIGTHSNRKWAESMAVSKIDGPTRNQVCLRAGQSVGRVQDCYMKQEDDGDAITGRTVALLKITADEFDVLPPHFKNEVVEEISNYGWEEIIPGYNHYPETFQRAIRMTFPSLVYHFHTGKLKEMYSADDHPLWRVRFFTDRALLNSLKDKVLINFGHCEFTDMHAEGIPSLIQVCREVRTEASKLRVEFQELRQCIIEFMVEHKRHRDNLPKEVVDEILRQVTVDGVVPVTRDSINEIVRDIFNEENGKLQQILLAQQDLSNAMKDMVVNNSGGVSASNAADSTPVLVPSFLGEYSGEYHTWPGIDSQFHKVYAGFVWPSDCAFTMWELWWRGDRNKRVCPYRHIDSNKDLIAKSCKTKRTKTLKVVNTLVSIAIDEQIVTCVSDIQYENSTAVFDKAYPKLIEYLYSDDVVMRSSETNILTLANRLYKVNHD